MAIQVNASIGAVSALVTIPFTKSANVEVNSD